MIGRSYSVMRVRGTASTAPLPLSTSPSTGPSSGGTSVTVTGMNFKAGCTATLGGASVGGVGFLSSTQITIVTPAGSPGAAALVVTNPDGQSGTLANAFTYITSPAPTLASANYQQGDIAGGGQSIVLTGTNMSTVTSVTIAGASVSPTGTTATTVTFTLPAHAAGTGFTVSVTNPGGTSGTLAFEYWSPVQITGIDAYLDANKSVTGGASVSAWLDQSANSRNFVQATGGNQPAQTSSVFGALPSIRFNGTQWVAVSPPDNIASGGTGRSFFAVMKQASSANRTTPANAGVGNAPYQIIGDRVNGYGGLGMANGVITDNYYTGAYFTTSRGSGLNDSNPHLVGATDDTVGGNTTVRVYLGASQQGAGNVNAQILSASTYDTIGLGYSTGDGFVGDLGAVVVVAGVIASGDLAKLNKWSQQRWGTP